MKRRKLVYTLIGVTIFVLTGLLVFNAGSAIGRINTPPPEEYLNISAKQSPGGQWAKDFLTSLNLKTSESSAPRQPFDFKTCNSFNLLPKENYATYSGTGDGVEVYIQLFSPGYAQDNFNKTVTSINNCWQGKTLNVGNISTKVHVFDRHAVYTYGDVIVFLKTSDKKFRDDNIPTLVDKTAESLQLSKCSSLSETVEDKTRNPYVEPDGYKGFFVSTDVKPQIRTDNIPTQKYAAIANPVEADKPESPLPDKDFPKNKVEIKAERPKNPEPVKPLDPSVASRTVTYEMPDRDGPGCGWSWAGLNAPIVDNDRLEQERAELIATTQNEINQAASEHVQQENSKAIDNLLLSVNIDAWNRQVAEHNKVSDKWNWLNNERKRLKPLWDDYVKKHDEWINFDINKDNARKDYDEAVRKCDEENKKLDEWYRQKEQADREREDWDRTYRNQTFTPTPSAPPSPTATVGEQPAGCPVLPEKPAILDQQKPSEPIAPKIDGVPNPDSWQKPLTEPNVEPK